MLDRALRPRIRTVLLIVNLAILALPLAGIASLRLYENELIRSTEAQVLVQAAFVREIFLDAYEHAWGGDAAGWSAEDPRYPSREALLPSLDIARKSPLPPAPPAVPPKVGIDPLAAEAGRQIEAPLRAAARSTLAAIRVTDAAGTVVASTGSEIGLSLTEREEVTRALRGEVVSLLRQRISDEPVPPLESISRGQRYRVFVAVPVRSGGRVIGSVIVSRTPLDISKALWLNRRPLFWGATVVLAVVILVSALTSLTVSRPLRGLVERARRVARGEHAALAPVGGAGIREVGQLSEALAGMARTLEERAEYIKTFASHVSHEFKTPLTTLRGSLELLRDHFDAMSAEERTRFLDNADAASKRLHRLVGRLLELARADVARLGEDVTGVEEVVAGTLERFRLSGLSVSAAVEDRGIRVRMSAEVLEEILGNLLDNARLHGGPDVSVRITARRSTRSNPRAIEILVEDNGPGISEGNAPRVFTPFFTTARERGGSGLGLSIVQALVNAHGGSIVLEPRAPGAAFRVVLPEAEMP